MTDFDVSTPDPAVTTSDLGERPKAMHRNALRELIVFTATIIVLGLIFGAVHLLFGESQEPLHRALDRHKYDEAVQLIRLSTDVNAPNVEGELPLVLAADDLSADAYDVVRELLLHGARVNETDSNGHTALHQAAYHGNMAVADLLLRNGADINATRTYENIFGEQTETPLVVAYQRGRFRMAEFLTYRGADIPDNLEHLKRMGEGERLRERYSKLPKPKHLSEYEWSKEITLRVMREVIPERAQLLEDFQRMNPEVMKTVENIFSEPPPEGIDERVWEDQKVARVNLLFQSGQLNLKIPELKK